MTTAISSISYAFNPNELFTLGIAAYAAPLFLAGMRISGFHLVQKLIFLCQWV